METNPKKQRQHFYRDYASGQWSMSDAVHRPTDSAIRLVGTPMARDPLVPMPK